jgi:hypothetical protein
MGSTQKNGTLHQHWVWDAFTPHVNSVAFSRDDMRIVSGSGDKTAADALTGAVLIMLNGHTSCLAPMT